MRNTSLDAYTVNAKVFRTKRERMLDLFLSNPKTRFTDQQLAYTLNMQINCVCGRRNELAKMGKITEAGTVLNFKTGVHNTAWRLKQ